MTIREAAVASIFIGTVIAGSVWILFAVLANILALRKRIGNRKDAQAPPEP